MESDSFNAYILSNGCLSDFPDNKSSSFSVRFPFSAEVEAGKNGVFV